MQRWVARIQVLFFAAAVAAGFAGAHPAIAQDQGPPPPDAAEGHPGGPPPPMSVDKQLERMTKRYSLTDAEKTQIRPILTDEKQKMDALFQDQSLAPEDRFPKMKAIHDDEVTRVSAVLTDEQRAKYQQDQARMSEHLGPGGPGGGDGPPPPPDGDAGGGPPPGN